MNVKALYVVLAALFWGISGGIGGILMGKGWDPFVVSLYRGGIGLACVLVWLALGPGENGLASGRLWLWSVIAGLGVAGNFSFYFVSIAEGSVAIAATLMYSAPVFIYLFSFVFGLEKPTLRKALAIAVVMAGIVLLTQIYDIGAGGLTMLGVGAGLLAGLSYTVFIFGFKYAAPHGSPPAILTVAFTVLVIALMGPSDTGQVIDVLSTPDRPLFLVLGVLGAGLSFLLYILWLRDTEPAVASVVAMIEPVTAALFGVLILSEALNGLQVIGMGLILVTVTALSVRSSAGEETSGVMAG
ncbi:MAG: EamA family transporter [Bacteroidetes bacterium]|nr:EamA family transporter [Bacteroidota bacterium]